MKKRKYLTMAGKIKLLSEFRKADEIEKEELYMVALGQADTYKIMHDSLKQGAK